jgi:uncharacterized protein
MMIPVKIPNRHNHQLFGIMHNPVPDNDRGVCIVLLSPGVKSRVAPHRLYVRMARRYASLGYMVLRFDFSGLGDSQGENEESRLVDLYNAVQLGKFVEDTIDVLNWLEKHHGQKLFILAGLCGGAITGLHTGVKDDRVMALLSLGIPVVLEGNGIDKRLFMTPHQLESHRTSFIRKAFRFEAWKRLLSLKSDFKLLYLTFVTPALARLRGADHALLQHDPDDNLNPLFHKRFKEFAKNRKVLLVFGESDKLLWDYQEKYLTRHRSSLIDIRHNIEMRVIPKANHILSFREWTEDMLTVSEEWLTRFAIAAQSGFEVEQIAEQAGHARN